MNPTGFYRIHRPVGAEYHDTMTIQIVVPRTAALCSRIGGALAMALTPFGIANSGQLDPAEALKRNQNNQAA